MELIDRSKKKVKINKFVELHLLRHITRDHTIFYEVCYAFFMAFLWNLYLIPEVDEWDLINSVEFVHFLKVYTIKNEQYYGWDFLFKNKKIKREKKLCFKIILSNNLSWKMHNSKKLI